jgi:hypothetical protein
VVVYPNAQAPGYTPGTYTNLEHVQGYGFGKISLEVPNPDLIPHNHTFEIRFKSPQDSIKAASYELYDVTFGNNDTIFVGGTDLIALGRGPVGSGMLPLIFTPFNLERDTTNSGFLPSGQTNLVLKTIISSIDSVPTNAVRANYPSDYSILFSSEFVDTSFGVIGVPSIPTKFKVVGLPKVGGQFPVEFTFRDVDANRTLSQKDEFIDIYGVSPNGGRIKLWRVQVDTVKGPKYENSIFPTDGDIYQLIINVPFNESDVFRFITDSSFINLTKQKEDYVEKPYVVPNPYLGMASFEQAPYAQTGRGERRIEFRALPVNATVRIYTITGELVQTLNQDMGFQGYAAWNLRSKDNLEVAPGLYIYHVEATGLDDYIGKFAIIK